jgi:hypothetical protein
MGEFEKRSQRERMNAYMREYNRRPEVKAQMHVRRIQRREKIFDEFMSYLDKMQD